MTLVPGLAASASLVVGEADTAIAMRSGAVPVLATPRLLALCEEATMAAMSGALEDGYSTVNVGVQFEHISPTPVGGCVTADARLERVEGRRLVFNVSARDDRGLVAAGRVTRVLVSVEQFMEKTR
jgi:fluoroacetyl-CoA thioesterase